MAGRPPRDVEVEVVFLRLPKDVVERVTKVKGRLEMQGHKLNTTQAYCRILETGCAALEGTLEGSETAAPAQRPLAKLSEIAGDEMNLPGYGFPEDEDETPAQVSATNGTHAPAPTTQPAIPLALEPAPTTAPAAVKTAPLVPTGMQQCPLGHAPYPLSARACPTCGRERKRTQRQKELAPAPEAPAVPRPRREQYKLTPQQEEALRAKRQQGTPIKALMTEYGISKATVHRYLAEGKDTRERSQRPAGVR